MSLSMKDNHNPECDALNEFKSTTASVVSLYESGWQVQPDDPFTENKLLPTDVVDRWQLLGIVTPVENKEGLSLCTWWSTCRDGVAKSTPPQYTVTSPWNKPTPIKHFVNDDSVPASAACGCSLSADACLSASPTHPLQANHYFQGCCPNMDDGFPWHASVSRSHSKDDRSGNPLHVQLQLHQKLICRWKIFDLHVEWRTLQVSVNGGMPVAELRADAGVLDRLQMMSGRVHGITADFWQIAVFGFIGVWPWKWYGTSSYYERA